MNKIYPIYPVGTKQSEFLKASNDLFEILLEFKDYSVVLLDATGHVMNWNLGAQHIFGYSHQEVIGLHVSHFYTEEERQSKLPWKHLKTAQETGRMEREGWRYKKDGTSFYANSILTTIGNDDESIKGFAKVTRDISKQKKLEDENKLLAEQLEEKIEQRTMELLTVNKELEAFSYSVSHDLRAPLRAITGYSNILQQDYSDQLDEEANKLIKVIIDNSKMMSTLIDELLSFSKMARLEIVDTSTNMYNLAKDCLNELLHAEDRNKYEITIRTMPLCRGDDGMLKQVWFNLISNAIKYSSKKLFPKIEIGAVSDDNSLIYYVKDNGAGFSMQYYNKLFGVFQRLHRLDEFDGTGVGLALAKRIVNKHGGEIWAESALGEGSAFYFKIPK